MALRFRPVDASFYALFTTSANHLVTGAGLLVDMLGVTQGGRYQDAAGAEPPREWQTVAERMREAEHLADEATHDIIRRVNSTFVTPFDREDIYNLASSLDDVMDFMEEAVDLILLYRVHELPQEVSEQVEVIQRCAELTADAMTRLKSMKDLEEYWIEVNRLENTGDRTYRRILARLFSGEYDALEVLKLKDVVDSLEAAIDGFEKVANVVEQISVKES